MIILYIKCLHSPGTHCKNFGPQQKYSKIEFFSVPGYAIELELDGEWAVSHLAYLELRDKYVDYNPEMENRLKVVFPEWLLHPEMKNCLI